VEVGDGCLGEGFDRLASGFPGGNAAIQEPGDAVETDPAELRDGFLILAGIIQNQDEVPVVGGEPAGPGEEIRAETERDGAGDVTFTERLLAAAIDDEGAGLGAGGDFADEESISGEEGDRFGPLGGIDEQVGEVFRVMARSGEGAEDEATDGDFVTGVERGVWELLLAEAAALERCAGGGVITRG
jgi:hypothetical protein